MQFRNILLLLGACIALTAAASATENFRPIIGVLTEPLNESEPQLGSFLPASYVKWLESAGARVAPVRLDRHKHFSLFLP
jgi:gamma-glutamyl hydrolase